MKTLIKFLSRAVLVTALIFTSCSKEYEEDTTATNENPIRLKATNKEQQKEDLSFNKEDLETMLNSIAVLIKIEYPIKDMYAFEKAISSFNNPSINKAFEKSYSKSEFPLYSYQEAFKIHYFNNPMFGPIRPIFPNLPSINPELPDDVGSEPTVCEVLKRDDFSPAATDCGCRVYSAAMRGGQNHWQATIEAVFAAINYDPLEGCNL